MSIDAKLVRYSGHVQGVGFRYTTVRIARGYPSVSGYVKNLADGRVELMAEGPSADVAGFLVEVSQVMGQFVREERTEARNPTHAFSGFRIR